MAFAIIAAVVVGLTLTPQLSHLRNFAVWGEHSIHDYRTHPARIVEKGDKPQPWPFDSLYNKKEISQPLLDSIDHHDTHAFLVIQHGKLVYERYWDGYDSTHISGSFSAAKSIISLLIGIAIDQGRIKSVNDPAGTYLKHFNTNGLEKVTIRDLLTMSSGTNYSENDQGYFSLNATAYYGDDMDYLISLMERQEAPGQFWEYRSGDTQVLGLIVENVFDKSIAELVSQYFTNPMGAEQQGLWLLDGASHHEKAFCCYNAVARDYARFGQLLLNKGKWNGKQLISEKYLTEATTPAAHLKDRTENNRPVDYYGYQYWILNHKNIKTYAMNGLFGQYVYTIPEYDAVVVRLGESKVGPFFHHFQAENFTYLDAALSIIDTAR